MPKEQTKILTPQMLVRSHEQVVKKSLEKHGLIAGLGVRFPKRNGTPLMGRIGAWLVNKAGGTLAVTYRFNDTITSEPSPEEK